MAGNSDNKISAERLHKALGIPYQYLRQLLKNLAKDGFIKSVRGRSGGYKLSRETGTISLFEIVVACEGRDLFERCIMGFKSCPFNRRCPMHNIWNEARSHVVTVLTRTKLSDLINISANPVN